jgi:hypothetical protein
LRSLEERFLQIYYPDRAPKKIPPFLFIIYLEGKIITTSYPWFFNVNIITNFPFLIQFLFSKKKLPTRSSL